MARDIRQQLDSANGEKKAKLIEAFRVFLEQIVGTTNDEATLQWAGRTLMELGEAAMQPGEVKAVGQSAQLLTTAVTTFKELQKKSNTLPLAARFQLGRADRLLGNYAAAINTFEQVLKEKPMMLDAQVEAAKAYEQWAGQLAPQQVARAYAAALNGGRPAANKKNTIWGWGRISQLTNGKPEYRDIFFEARYHVALCRYLQGKALKSDKLKDQAITDITLVHSLYPDLGSPKSRDRFDRLLKQIQKDRGIKAVGLPAAKPQVGT
jgi:tetratricopeptide (TPR) repeat protein